MSGSTKLRFNYKHVFTIMVFANFGTEREMQCIPINVGTQLPLRAVSEPRKLPKSISHTASKYKLCIVT